MSIPGIPQRRRWPWIAAAAVLIGLGAWIATSLQPSTPTGPTEESSAPAPSTEPTDAPTDPSTPPPTSPPAGGGVDACLGGDARTIDTVVAAREAAPDTVDGAISFGATYLRWFGQKPAVSEADIVIAEQFTGNVDLRADAASWNQAPADQFGDVFYTSTVNGFYRVESMTDNHVDVSYMLRGVRDGAVDPDNVMFTTVSMDWDGDGWTVTGEPDGASSETMRDTGTAFAGGC